MEEVTLGRLSDAKEADYISGETAWHTFGYLL